MSRLSDFVTCSTSFRICSGWRTISNENYFSTKIILEVPKSVVEHHLRIKSFTIGCFKVPNRSHFSVRMVLTETSRKNCMLLTSYRLSQPQGSILLRNHRATSNSNAYFHTVFRYFLFWNIFLEMYDMWVKPCDLEVKL